MKLCIHALTDKYGNHYAVAELFLGVPLFPGTSEYNQLALITHVLG